MAIACVIMIVLIGDHAADPADIPAMQITFVVLFYVFVVAVLSSVSRSFCVITLSKDAISIKIPFQKKKIIQYEKYPYIFYGRYFHGNVIGLGLWVPYIVFSQNRIPSDLLTHINNLKNTPETFKIRFTPKNYNDLCSMLPDNYRIKLDAALRRSGAFMANPQ